MALFLRPKDCVIFNHDTRLTEAQGEDLDIKLIASDKLPDTKFVSMLKNHSSMMSKV